MMMLYLVSCSLVLMMSEASNQTVYRYSWSCEDSAYTGLMSMCDMVNWRSARVTRRKHNVVTGQPVDGVEELSYGNLESIVSAIISDSNYEYLDWEPKFDGGSCAKNRKRVACGYFFRRCRYEKPEMIAQNMCRSVCQDYRNTCFENNTAASDAIIPLCDNVFDDSDTDQWDCDDNMIIEEESTCKQENDEAECVLIPRDGYFLLDIEYGPYEPFHDIYLAFLVLWTLLFVSGIVMFFVVINEINDELFPLTLGNSMIRMVIIVTVVKAGYVGITYSFWTTCLDWGECSYWLNVGRSNLKLVFETFLFLVLILIGKGWHISRDTISQFELRRTVLIVCLFYLGDSLLMVLQLYVGWFFWILLCCVFLSLLTYILRSVKTLVNGYGDLLTNIEVESPVFDSVFAKFRFFLRYRVLCALFVLMFIVSSGMMTTLKNVPLWPQYLALETLTFTFVLLLLLTFVSDASLFNGVGNDVMFDSNGNARMAPVLTADVKALIGGDSSSSSSSSTEEGSTSSKQQLKNRTSSTTILSPIRVKKSKKNKKGESLASVVVVVHPGDVGFSMGVESRFTSVFSKRTNRDNAAASDDQS